MTTVNPKDFLHLVAVLFMGSDDLDSSVDSLTLAVSEETMQACFENHELLATSTFSRHATPPEDEESAEDSPVGASDGSNLDDFKRLLSDLGRSDDFIETVVKVLPLLDEQKRHHEDLGHSGEGHGVDIPTILNKLKDEGFDEAGQKLVYKSPVMRDGLRSYAQECLGLKMPKNKFDRKAERTREQLGEDRSGWDDLLQRYPSFSTLLAGESSVTDDALLRAETGMSAEELEKIKIEEQAPPSDELVIPGLTHGPVEPSILPITRYVLHAPDPPHPVVTAALEAATARANARERQLMDYTELSAILLPVLLHLVDRDGNDLDALRELSQLLYSSKVPKLAAILWPLLDDELRDELGWEEASELEAALVRQDQSSLFTAADAGAFRDRIQKRRAAIKAAATP